MKAEILALLRDRADFVSGQELCEHFGVSRTAVWKAIGRLKEEGYRIEAVPNKGYRLLETEEVYGQNEIASRMNTRWVGKPVLFFDCIGSTNAQAKIDAENGAESGTLIVADMQTAGRGRRGRSWTSPAGTNIYYTLILKPKFDPDKASMLTLVMAMAVVEGIEKYLTDNGCKDVTCGIKWPNDIVLNGKKICGILTEMSAERDYIQHVVIGVGINVYRQEFAPELQDKATSMEEECKFHISRSTLIALIMEAFEKDYELFVQDENLSGLKAAYEKLLINKGREVCVLDPQGEYRGKALGITDGGELQVQKEDGTVVCVYAGEVSVRGLYGYV